MSQWICLFVCLLPINSHPHIRSTSPWNCAPAERVGIGAGSQKTRMTGYRADKVVWRYLQPCGSNVPTWQTDGQTTTGRQQRPRLRIASRGKKNPPKVLLNDETWGTELQFAYKQRHSKPRSRNTFRFYCVSMPMQAERDIVLPILSVRPSVCLTPVLCQNEWIGTILEVHLFALTVYWKVTLWRKFRLEEAEVSSSCLVGQWIKAVN